MTRLARELIKINRGGEWFWCEVLSKDEDTMRLRCDNDTVDPESPRYNEEFEVDADEPFADRVTIPYHA